MITAQELKAETEALLAKRGYPINPHLPLIEEQSDLHIATPIEVRHRCLVLSGVCARAYGAPYELVSPWMDRHGLRAFCTASEAALIDAKQSPESQKAPFRAQVDALWEFAWVLAMMPIIDHFSECSEQLVHMFPKPGEDPTDFVSATQMRSREELFREADLLYRIDWGVRNASLRDEKPPTSLPEWVTLYRRQAIDWTIDSRTRWDRVDLST
jgi:hypothetical protein